MKIKVGDKVISKDKKIKGVVSFVNTDSMTAVIRISDETSIAYPSFKLEIDKK